MRRAPEPGSRFTPALGTALVGLLPLLPPAAARAQEGAAPEATALVAHANVALTPRYDPPDGGLERPERVDAILTLLPGGDGLLSRALPTSSLSMRMAVSAVTWTRQGDRFELDPGLIGVMEYGGVFDWSRWSLELSDTDGDGVLDGGRGTSAGTWQRMMGDVIDFADYEGDLAAVPDTAHPVAILSFLGAPRPWPLDDRLLVVFSEPVRWEESAFQLRVDGTPEPIHAAPIRLVHGHATGFTLQLDRLAPLGASLALETTLTDPAGLPARWDGDTLVTPPDPGPIPADADFESGLAGWLVDGRVSRVDRSPAGEEGSRALVESGGRLTGLLDVPADAVRLEIEAEFFSEIGEYQSGTSGVIELVAPGSRTSVFDASGGWGGGPCECAPYGHTTGPLRLETTLVPFRGRRVLLGFSAAGARYIGMNEYGIAVRRVRIVREGEE